MSRFPRFSFIVSGANDGETLRATLDSILSQESEVECFVVNAGTDEATHEIIREFANRLTFSEIVPPGEEVAATNRAFARSRGELFWWLTGAERLCPWACHLVSHVFENLPEVQWLTSGTPITWTPTQMCVPSGLAAGYNKTLFFQGRNLKTSPYFRHPIWRAGTIWRRRVWNAAGNYIDAPVERAGDFELWIRFWQTSAVLHTMNLPLAGPESSAHPGDAEAYWHAAAAHLDASARLPAPSAFKLRLKSLLIRRFPERMRPYTDMAGHVRIAPSTLECAVLQLPIV